MLQLGRREGENEELPLKAGKGAENIISPIVPIKNEKDTDKVALTIFGRQKHREEFSFLIVLRLPRQNYSTQKILLRFCLIHRMPSLRFLPEAPKNNCGLGQCC